MHPIKRLLPLALLAIVALLGCSSDDGVTGPGQTDVSDTGLVRGEIGGTADFEFLSAPASDRPGPRPGPFLIRGSNLHYDSDLGALVVDLTVTNAGDRSYPEPVSLTFVSLSPDTITVLNADNGETGPGAMFACQFENDDAQWTPGEESIPFTVQFGVAQGVSIGFVARVDVGMVPGGGTLGGLVWHDVNEDGMIDADEAGLPDVVIALVGPDDHHLRALTGPDGTYRFDGLPAGYYTVTRLPRDDLRATTPPRMNVILVVDENGDVSDFIGANFGCLVMDTPPGGGIEVGDNVDVKGDFTRDPLHLQADQVCVRDDNDDHDCRGRIEGPVTAVHLDRRMVEVMGSALHLTEDSRIDIDLEELEPGDRVRVYVDVVPGDDGDELNICRIRSTHGHYDRIRGDVRRIGTDANGYVRALVLGVAVDLTGAQDCNDDDHDDDD